VICGALASCDKTDGWDQVPMCMGREGDNHHYYIDKISSLITFVSEAFEKLRKKLSLYNTHFG
jgi:hypothetical protein